MAPRISLITAVYNRADTLPSTLASVRAQTWGDVEHVVVDAASTDGTAEILQQHRDGIAQLVCEPDDGIYDGLNKGIRLATGDVVGFLHADDMFSSPWVLEKIAHAFSDPEVEAAYGDVVYVDRHQPSRVVRYWRAGAFEPHLLAHGWMPPHTSFYVRRELYERFGGFNTRYRISADYECLLRMLARPSARVAYIPEVLVRMRTGGASNNSLPNLIRKTWEDYSAMRQNGIGGLSALVRKNVSKLPQFFAKEPVRVQAPVELPRPDAPRG